jgi:hypothetical protein
MIRILMRNLTDLATPVLVMFLTTGTIGLAQQVSPNQSALLHVSVTDPLHRFVTGLDRESFAVFQNGAPCAITDFSSADSPLTLAIISESPLPPIANLMGPDDGLIESATLSGALRQLAASKNLRKAVILTAAADTSSVPADIQVVRAETGNVVKQVVELRNQYLLRFQSSTPTSRVEVILKQPIGLPALKAAWTQPF